MLNYNSFAKRYILNNFNECLELLNSLNNNGNIDSYEFSVKFNETEIVVLNKITGGINIIEPNSNWRTANIISLELKLNRYIKYYNIDLNNLKAA